jgi:hypothetical protein
MRSFAPLLACTACLLTVPAYAGSSASTDNPVVLVGARVCVGPACVGRDHDRDGRYRHGREYHHHYGYDRGYGYGNDRDRGDYRYER